ncbi:hypothetical protein GGP93_001549 [Salinibacter ruber]|jgi:hypothetical protein|nr:hypothetical protein [Salinibacter ruber]
MAALNVARVFGCDNEYEPCQFLAIEHFYILKDNSSLFSPAQCRIFRSNPSFCCAVSGTRAFSCIYPQYVL